MIYQPVLDCSLSIYSISCKHGFECRASTDIFSKSLCSAITRDQPQTYFRLPELCVVAAYPKMTGHGQLAAPSQCKSIHGGNDRLGCIFNFKENIKTGFCKSHPFLFCKSCKSTYVSTGCKCFATGTCDNSSPNKRVIIYFLNSFTQFPYHRCIECI